MYPNEVQLTWSVLIVLYPFITGLVAGAFILASLARVFNIVAVQPIYRLSLLTALAFLLVAPLPLQLHLGHPERSFEMYMTPHRTSAMAMFGFVYLWYLLVVLLLEIWLDYRRDIVLAARSRTGVMKWIYSALTLGSRNIDAKSLHVDDRVGWMVTLIGIPSAFLLHGYVGFIFGSVKANPWWSTPLMPVVFLFSAMVSGIAVVLLVYQTVTYIRNRPIDMACLDTVAKYLLYIFLIDFSLEMLDLIHRMYEASESFRTLDFMVHTQLLCLADRCADYHRDRRSHRSPGACSGGETGRNTAPPNLYSGRGSDPDRHLRHALECGHRRATFFEEFPGLYDLQDGVCGARRFAARHCPHDPALPDSVGITEAASALGGTEGLMTARRRLCRHHPPIRRFGSRDRANLGELILQVQDLRQRVLNLEERLGSTVAAPQAPVRARYLSWRLHFPQGSICRQTLCPCWAGCSSRSLAPTFSAH